MKITKEQIAKARSKSGLTQTEFWKNLGITQSGGSRYESGRNIPIPVQRLFWLTHVSDAVATLPQKAMKALQSIGK